jgi:hypothetical protein
MTKEEHAKKIIAAISEYGLCQRYTHTHTHTHTCIHAQTHTHTHTA